MTAPAPFPSPAPVVAVNDLKDFLRIDRTWVDEDPALQMMLARCIANVRRYLGVPYFSTLTRMFDRGHQEEAYTFINQVLIPIRPVDLTQPIILTSYGDADVPPGQGEPQTGVVDPTTYVVESAVEGIARMLPGYFIAPGRIQIDAYVGWTAHPNYREEIMPILQGAILDWAAEIYNHRNPGAQSESEAGVSVSHNTSEWVPKRIMSALESLRGYTG